MTAPDVVTRTSFVAAEDLSSAAVVVAIAVVVVGLIVLALEVRRAREARRVLVVISGVVAALALLGAVLRPHRLRAREIALSPRVVVLLDRSRSMALTSTDRPDGTPRIDLAERVVEELRKKTTGRLDVLAFGAKAGPRPDAVEAGADALARADGAGSDLGGALRAVLGAHEDPPASIVVVSDGQVDVGDLAAVAHGPKIHAVAIGEGSPPDASIRSVRVAGAAVAHQALPLRVEVACTGGLSCGDLTVTVRELREVEAGAVASPEAILATGTATVRDGTSTIELPITLERAGTRVVEVSIAAPKGDALPDDDRRLLSIDVARERVRVLHIAGRPTYDVRALRAWLKSDAAMDVVSFFILRTAGDEVGAPDEELALIPFPVQELFTKYLPTFDAIIFQDFDAEPYGLAPHLPAIARYVEHGGGLIHVGGPNAFSAGGYSGTPLAKVTPVDIPRLAEGQQSADTAPFVPVRSPAARVAPILAEVDALVGEEMIEFAGTSVVGDLRGAAVALWTHPKRTTPSGKPMPVLAIGDVGDGRSIALGLDSTRRLGFSGAAIKSGGRGFDALWRGLLGWLMRDPRYEPVRGRLVHAAFGPPCVAGAKAAMRIDASPTTGPARLRASITALVPPRARAGESIPRDVDAAIDGPLPYVVPLGVAPEGAFALRMAIGEATANAPALGALATRTLAVCERGGDEWADPRPDRARLEALAKAAGGVVVAAADIGSIPPAKTTLVALERTVSPILPGWAWAALAAVTMGIHWFVRRRSGLA